MCIENDTKLKTWINQTTVAGVNQTVDVPEQEKENFVVNDCKLVISEESKEYEDEVIILKNNSDITKTLASANKSFDELLDVNVGSNEEEYIEEEQHQIALEEFECSICNKVFKNKNHLKTHNRIHSKTQHEYICSICGQQFNYSYLLKKHSYKHESNKPFPCTRCDKGMLHLIFLLTLLQ